MESYFTRKDLINFYIRFLINKRRIITDCKTGRLQLFIVETLWIMNGIFGGSVYSTLLMYRNYFETKKGKFYIHRDLQSAITISPTYEIDDSQELVALIARYVKNKNKILFIDVGTHVGAYSIFVGKKFRRYKKIDIIGFDPDANNFYENNSSIFIKNIKLNNLKNIKLYKIGLGSRDTKKPNKFGFVTKKLDSILSVKYASKYDVVFIKIDIEGYEEDALRGAIKFIKNSKKVYLLIEDCVKKDVYKYMKKNFNFYKKISPYNSFWTK